MRKLFLTAVAVSMGFYPSSILADSQSEGRARFIDDVAQDIVSTQAVVGRQGAGQVGGMGDMGGTMGDMTNMMGRQDSMMWSGANRWRGGDSSMMGGMMGPIGFAGLGLVGMLLFWIVVIVGVVLLIKWAIGMQGSGQQEKTALGILKERYAKGEIDKKEFEEKKRDLI